MGKTLLRSDFKSDCVKRGGRKVGCLNKVKAKRKSKNPTPPSEIKIDRSFTSYDNVSAEDIYKKYGV